MAHFPGIIWVGLRGDTTNRDSQHDCCCLHERMEHIYRMDTIPVNEWEEG